MVFTAHTFSVRRTLYAVLAALLLLPALGHAQAVQSYDQLISAIRQVRSASEARIEAAVEQEKVREAWETGKLIDEHILQHKERQQYGAQVIKRVSKDLGTSETELRYMVQFVRTYPDFHRAPDGLPWGHIESLLALNEEAEREAVVKEAIKQKWSLDKTRAEVRRRKSKQDLSLNAERLSLPEIKPGKPGVYRITEDITGSPVLDLGFSNYLDVEKKKFKTGDIVTAKNGEFVVVKEAKDTDLYTFEAKVVNIIDGDTFTVDIDLGFGFSTIQTLRLRALDAPEIISADGKQAKKALEEVLGIHPAKTGGQKIIVKTSKGEDQYGRYLADIWIKDRNINQALLKTEVFTVRSDA